MVAVVSDLPVLTRGDSAYWHRTVSNTAHAVAARGDCALRATKTAREHAKRKQHHMTCVLARRVPPC
jgi:hypothetical protein